MTERVFERARAQAKTVTPTPGRGRSFAGVLQERMAGIEKRDWELWILALVMVAILSIGYFFVIFPTVFLGQKTFFIQATLSSPLLIGQLALVLLFLMYIAHKHMQVRALRTQSIVEALSFELAHAQLMLDPLTQAFNRAALEEVVSKELKRVARQQTTVVFLYMDVDNLKEVNTRFGHLSGDLVLTEVGGIIKSCVRGSDYVIRMGGDEFLVVLADTNVAGAEIVKGRIMERADQWTEHSPLSGFQMTLSIGVEMFDGSRTFDEVLADADKKMYREKESHRARKTS